MTPLFKHWRRLGALALAAGLCGNPSALVAQALPLPDQLIGLASEAGEKLLFESEARRPYLPLSIHFVTQKNQAYCGVASITMVLNALGMPAPADGAYAPYRLFTQDNVLNAATEAIVPEAVIAARGMTLDQLGMLLGSHGVAVSVRHAEDVTLAQFRREAVHYLAQGGHHVLVNYLRRTLGQERGGHISPLAAYDADSDRFLILDVSRYKYPPVWVGARQLFDAMHTPDADNGGRSRGYVLVRRAGED